MQLENFLLMRHEILLIFIALVALVYEIVGGEKNKTTIIPIIIVLFAINTIVGFIPIPTSTNTLFGGMYILTDLQIVMKNVLNVGVLIVLIQSVAWLKKDENKGKVPEFFILLISTLIGMNFMISSGDFLMFYIGLELATIPIAALAAYDRSKNKSAEAGIKLILSSAFSSGILLFGISIFYAITGSIYFSEIAIALGNPDGLMALGLIFFFAGMGFKISLVPFHLWTADVYEGAPIAVTSFLSVVSKGAAAFIFTFVLYTVFPIASEIWLQVLVVLSIVTMTIGNLFAMRQLRARAACRCSNVNTRQR